MLKKITSSKFFSSHAVLIFVVFVVAHLFLLNINFAEWGDSYRILRASEFVRQGEYPEDEKRAPLYSIFLALRPESLDQVVWGRVQMLSLSILFLYIFYLYLKEFKLGERFENLSLWMLVFNPVFLYWSIRLMADVPFAFLVLLVAYVHKKWLGEMIWWKYVLVGLVVGLAVLTRFEGYILGFSYGAWLVYDHLKDKKGFTEVGALAGRLFYVLLGFLAVSLPWYLLKNPFTSSYFEEPSGRVYDFKMIYIYLVSLMYVFGFTSACYFFSKQIKDVKKFVKKNVFVTIFVLIELFLALLWPAAIPRLFTPIIPFMVILIAYLIDEHFKDQEKPVLADYLGLGFLLVFYVTSQYILKLQFLVLIKYQLVVVFLVQIIILAALLAKKYKIFKLSLIVSMVLWSFSTIFIHKDIFKAVVKANKYLVNNIEGKVAYNDVSSVSDWYLNQKSSQDNVEGFYLNMDSREGRTYEILKTNQVDYVMITNEHNTDMEFNPADISYLEEIKEFRYTIRGEQFFTKVLKFNEYE